MTSRPALPPFSPSIPVRSASPWRRQVALLLGAWLLGAAGLSAAVPNPERVALLAFYNATGGAAWTSRTGWGGPAGTECDWRGIACNGSRNAVVGISLSSNHLVGALPSGLTSLTQLQSLELEDNALTGSVPKAWAGFAHLKSLHLGLNQLAGALPAELGDFAALETLSLPFNRFSGAIPTSLGRLANLKTLDLDRNELTGSIPAQLGSLASLELLDLSGNHLSGAIPSQLGGLGHLDTLFLAANELSGTIPASLSGLGALTQLGLSENALTGGIPAGLGTLANLRFADFRRNLLTGSIPPGLGSLSALESLLLSNNRFGGTIPKELGSLVALQVLWIDGNRFVGPLPEELGDLVALGDDNGLDLRGNAFATDLDAGLLLYLNGKQRGGEWVSSQQAAAQLDPGSALQRLADPRAGGFLLWRIDIGSNAPALTLTTSGGSGNSDLYLRFGAIPSESQFDASSTGGTNAETLTVAHPQAGTYYVGLRAATPYSGVTLQTAGLAGGCVTGSTALCLGGGRFKVEATWKTADARTGAGHPVALSGDTGTFWFFDASNVEMVVKALDGCGINGSFWLFAGGLSNVQIDLTVTDTLTSISKTYRNPQGTAFQPIQDTKAFSTCSALAASRSARSGDREVEEEIERRAEESWREIAAALEPVQDKAGSCVADATHLCLAGGRFRVEATWKQRNGTTGAGMAVPLTADTGIYWFFNAANVEMILKILTACPVNGKFWVFAGGLTDVDTEIKVTDTMTGAQKTYRNPQGTAFLPIQDTGAFSCP